MRHSLCRAFLGRVSLLGIGVGVSLLSLACTSDTTGPAPLDPAHLYWKLTLNHHAITLALIPPYDTLQLIATPWTATGSPLTDTSTTSYTVTDASGNPDTNVTVSPSGLLKAVAPEFGIQVIARHTVGSLTFADTATINVNDVSPVPRFAALVLHFQPGDSARWTSRVLVQPPGSVIGLPTVTPSALDAQGDQMADIAIRLIASDTTYEQLLQFGILEHYRPEHLLLIADATAYGTSITDTVHYTVGWPLLEVIRVFPRTSAGSATLIGDFNPPDDTVAVGATVIWVNDLNGVPVDVIFDDSTAVQSADSAEVNGNAFVALVYRLPNEEQGNIPPWRTVLDTIGVYWDGSPQTVAEVRARRFPMAGTYRYRSALYGTTGVLHVLPEFRIP